MYKLIIFLFLFIAALQVISQDSSTDPINRPPNSINLNFLGDGSMISINYEGLVYNKPGSFVALKLGIGGNQEFTLFSEAEKTYITFPHHVTYNVGRNRNYFEIGIGGVFLVGPLGFSDDKQTNYIPYPILGYRRYPLTHSRFNYRAYVSLPLTGLDSNIVIFPPFGVSIGFCF